MRRDIPPQWVKLMETAGLTSMRQLATASGISHTAVARIIHGEGTPSDESIQQMAGTLRVAPADLYRMVGLATPTDAKRYEPPAESARLTVRQRRAVDEIIRLFAAATQADDKIDAGPLQADHDLAADKGINVGRATRDRLNGLGEESQDGDEV